ncbi:hypothetical protein [Candidatus Poriferisodalis sp.]|uniref:hypothetical protein n=1 Tax=Candidatus Poriferisodalis sp. TaxID=3101277 RepID=UPI003C6F212C
MERAVPDTSPDIRREPLRCLLTAGCVGIDALLAALADEPDMSAVEQGFVALAARCGTPEGVAYAAWREAGVPAELLARAGTSRGSNERLLLGTRKRGPEAQVAQGSFGYRPRSPVIGLVQGPAVPERLAQVPHTSRQPARTSHQVRETPLGVACMKIGVDSLGVHDNEYEQASGKRLRIARRETLCGS